MGRDEDLVADAAATLTSCFAAGEVLIGKPDAIGSGFISGGTNEPQPPWNAEAAYAVMIPWHELRALEAQVRRRAGLTVIYRGGSAGNTREALASLIKVARGLSREEVAYIARKLEGWAALTFALRAVDGLPQWLEIPLGSVPDCPWCATPSLRYHPAHGIVACLYVRCPSLADGRRPWAEITSLNGGMSWAWPDGTEQP